jgi:hypothetical protein
MALLASDDVVEVLPGSVPDAAAERLASPSRGRREARPQFVLLLAHPSLEQEECVVPEACWGGVAPATGLSFEGDRDPSAR